MSTGTPPRRRHWPTVLVVVAGLVALAPLLPIVATPISADGTYSYFLPYGQYGDDVAGVAAKGWTQLPDTAQYGRIAPVSWTVQWLHYWVGLKIAMLASIPLEIVNGVTRLLLLALVAWALHAYLRRVRVPGRVPAYLPRPLVRLVTVTTVLVFAAGARLDSPFRNALVAYPVFAALAAVLVFAVPALVLGVMSRQVRDAPREPWLGTVLLVVTGLSLALSYELWYVAGVAGLAAAVLQPLPRDRQRVRWRAVAAFGVPFTVGVLTVRVILHYTATGEYAGVSLALGRGLVTTFGWNVLNSLPGGGSDAERQAALMSVPPPTGWTLGWAVVMLVGAGALVALAVSGHRSARRWSGSAGRRVAAWAVRVLPLLLAVALSGALVMALSQQAQERIGPSTPFRNYVITWGCLAAVAGVLLAVTVAQRQRAAGVLGAAAVCAFLLVVGPVQASRIESWARAQQVKPPAPQIARVYDLFLEPRFTPEAAAQRCAALDGLGGNAYPVVFLRENVQEAFVKAYGVPFCATPTVAVNDLFPNPR